jgi:adenosylmethionine-8-amino-7-oxononanoate aminotransferase
LSAAEAPAPRRITVVLSPRPGGGKTTLAAALVRALRASGRLAAALRPVETGCTPGEDHDLVARDAAVFAEVAGWVPRLVLAPYRLPRPGLPVEAAAALGMELRLDDLAEAVRAGHRYADHLIVELDGGDGPGLAVDGDALALARQLEAHVVVVAPVEADAEAARLIEAARARGLVPDLAVLWTQGPVDEAGTARARALSAAGRLAVLGPVPTLGEDPQAERAAERSEAEAGGDGPPRSPTRPGQALDAALAELGVALLLR